MGDAAEVGGDGGAELVGAEDPAVDGADVAAAEEVGAESDRRRDGGDVAETEDNSGMKTSCPAEKPVTATTIQPS